MIKVFAPATVANVGSGFDVLGFALEQPGDEVHMQRSQEPGVKLLKITGDGGLLPTGIEKNSASFVVKKYLEKIGAKEGVEMELHKGMPIGSGLGSSSASSVAALVAVNELFDHALDKINLLQLAMEGERLACGTAHPDNVAPSLYGGITLIRSQDPLDLIEIQCPVDVFCSIVKPDVSVRTEDARNILRQEVKLSDAIQQWGNVAALVAGFMKGDLDLVGRSLHDHIVEPKRAMLIPAYNEVKAAALQAGALGASISGSGPSVFAISKSKEAAEKVEAAMKDAFQKAGLDTLSFVSKINTHGPKILS